MRYDELPIFKSALDFAVYIETIVRHFERYHKYTIGVDLRQHSKTMLYCVHRANASKDNRLELLEQLRDTCEEMKMLLRIAKELKAFNSFNSFEHASKLVVSICAQAQSWLNASARITK